MPAKIVTPGRAVFVTVGHSLALGPEHEFLLLPALVLEEVRVGLDPGDPEAGVWGQAQARGGVWSGLPEVPATDHTPAGRGLVRKRIEALDTRSGAERDSVIIRMRTRGLSTPISSLLCVC